MTGQHTTQQQAQLPSQHTRGNASDRRSARTSVLYHSALSKHAGDDGPNMTPMVDIMMCILIFFMASTVFLGPEWFLEAAVPRQGSASANAAADPFALPPARFTISLISATSEGGRITVYTGLDAEPASIDQLAARLAALITDAGPAGIDIVLEPTGDVPYEDVVRAQDIALLAGVNTVGIETRQLGGPIDGEPGSTIRLPMGN